MLFRLTPATRIELITSASMHCRWRIAAHDWARNRRANRGRHIQCEIGNSLDPIHDRQPNGTRYQRDAIFRSWRKRALSKTNEPRERRAPRPAYFAMSRLLEGFVQDLNLD